MTFERWKTWNVLPDYLLQPSAFKLFLFELFFLSPKSYAMMMIFSFDKLAFHNLFNIKDKCGTWPHIAVLEIISKEYKSLQQEF